jgi:aryl-alcohol dehydrogenase-like predicted oxidoreductase
MEHMMIPGTDVPASRIALGTWSIGGLGWGGADEAAAIRTIHGALDMGVNLFDTAPIYGKGLAEEILGKALAGNRRQGVMIATKCGLDFSHMENGVFTDSRREVILRELGDSLRRLQTDVIDLYQVHWPDPVVPFEETAEVFAGLKRQGKIRIIGVSNFQPAQMEAFQRKARISTNQPPYNLFEREIEKEVLPYCRKDDIAVISYSPLCRGLLSGRMRLDTAHTSDDIRQIDPKFAPERYPAYLAAVERLDRLARNFGKRVIDLALRWLLDQPGLSIVLWGGRKIEQLAPISSAWDWKLDGAVMKEIDRILAESIPDPVGPEYLMPRGRAAA